MFKGASAFNQDIGNWNVSSGEWFVSIAMNTTVALYESTHLNHNLLLCPFFCSQANMFEGASSFNQDIGDWDVSNGQYFVSIVMNTNIAI